MLAGCWRSLRMVGCRTQAGGGHNLNWVKSCHTHFQRDIQSWMRSRTVLSRCLVTRRGIHLSRCASKSSSQTSSEVKTTQLGIPTAPTWSIKSFLESSTDSTVIDDATLDKLHRLSALKDPEYNPPSREALRHELADLVKLVNAVRGYDAQEDSNQDSAVGGIKGDGLEIPDGRVYPLPVEATALRSAKVAEDDGEVSGRELLKHSQTTTANDALYFLPKKRID